MNIGDKGAVGHDLKNSRIDNGLRTIEDALNRFHLTEHFRSLEKSLEDVKRNKKSKKDHEQYLKSVDKELMKLSLRYHPDSVGKRGSNLDAADAHELQAALNATRKVLKILTEVFLKDIHIDYKYEYFSKLDISMEENGINHKIDTVLYKISQLSEIKRMNIIGEIRNFLVESQRCVESYFKRNRNDFTKYRDYALYHLRKNIEGYLKLEKECNMLNEESSEENDEHMISVIQSVVYESSKESTVLRSLGWSARRSFQGNFQLFSADCTMDKYYILPFVYYVNLLSICTMLLEHKRCSCFLICVPDKPRYERKRPLIAEAYNLATSIFHTKKCKKEETGSVGRSNWEVKYLDDKLMVDVFNALQREFRIDAYNEAKSNRVVMYGELLAVKKVLTDLQEKEQILREYASRYEREQHWGECNKIKADETVETPWIYFDENLRESSKSVINSGHDRKEIIEVDITKHKNKSQEDRNKCDTMSKDEEFLKTIPKSQLSENLRESSKSVINGGHDRKDIIEVDITKHKNETQEEWNNCNTVLKDDELLKIIPQSELSESVSGEESALNEGGSSTSETKKDWSEKDDCNLGVKVKKDDQVLKENINLKEKPSTNDSLDIMWHPLMAEDEEVEM